MPFLSNKNIITMYTIEKYLFMNGNPTCNIEAMEKKKSDFLHILHKRNFHLNQGILVFLLSTTLLMNKHL